MVSHSVENVGQWGCETNGLAEDLLAGRTDALNCLVDFPLAQFRPHDPVLALSLLLDLCAIRDLELLPARHRGAELAVHATDLWRVAWQAGQRVGLDEPHLVDEGAEGGCDLIAEAVGFACKRP